MLTIDNKKYRNLQEQVLYLSDKIENLEAEGGVLNEFGIKVVDRVDSSTSLPSVTDYIASQEALGRELDELYGDAIAVGTSAPYTLYIFTRQFSGAEEPEWFNIGQFPLAGPQGPQGEQGPIGEQGERGSRWFVQNDNPSLVSGYKLGDSWLNALTGDVYYFNGNSWIREGNIKGTQGIQGIPGPTGPQGIQGPIGLTGPQGPAGQSFTIAGVLSNTNQLPTPTEENRTQAYLVGDDDAGYDLYVIIGTTQLLWFNAGKVEGVKGDQGPVGPQGPQGVQGIAGKDGETIVNIESGNVIYGSSQTITPVTVTTSDGKYYSFNVVAQKGERGLIGPKGDTGPQGPQGIQGIRGPEGVVDYSNIYTKSESDSLHDQLQTSLNNRITNEISSVNNTIQVTREGLEDTIDDLETYVNANVGHSLIPRNLAKSSGTDISFFNLMDTKYLEASYNDVEGETQGISLVDASLTGATSPLGGLKTPLDGNVETHLLLPLINSDSIEWDTVFYTDKNYTKVKPVLAKSIMDQITANSQKYTKEEVNQLIANINQFEVEIVTQLPTVGETNKIYFILQTQGSGYNEYMYINNRWELIGTTQVDLSNYYTKTETESYVTSQITPVNSEIEGLKTQQNSLSGQLQDRLTKITGNKRIYATNNAGEQIGLVYDNAAIGPNEIVQRDGDGRILCPIPRENYHTANKEYVDQAISDIDLSGLNVPTKTSDLVNDSGFITNTVDNLTNYLTATAISANYYNKTEIDDKLTNLPTPESVSFADSDTVVVSDTADGAKQFNVAANLLNEITRSVKTPVSAPTTLELIGIEANSTNQTMRSIADSYSVTHTDDGTSLKFNVKYNNPTTSNIKFNLSSSGLYANAYGIHEAKTGTTVDIDVGDSTDRGSVGISDKTYFYNSYSSTTRITAITKLRCNYTNGVSVIFITGDSVTNSETSTKFLGDDCQDGVFTPQPNTYYEVFIWGQPVTYSGTSLKTGIVINKGTA